MDSVGQDGLGPQQTALIIHLGTSTTLYRKIYRIFVQIQLLCKIYDFKINDENQIITEKKITELYLHTEAKKLVIFIIIITNAVLYRDVCFIKAVLLVC